VTPGAVCDAALDMGTESGSLPPDEPASDSDLDAESAAWIAGLASIGSRRELVLRDLHDHLVRAARREGERRRGSLPPRVAADLDDLARQAADDALVAVLRKLPTFRGQSRFTTWAFKFALFEMSVALRREAWRGRAIALDDEGWGHFVDRRPLDPAGEAEVRELAVTVRNAVETALTPRQREVFIAVVIQGVPIDVVAGRTGRTRNATYKILHDARGRLRADLVARGWPASTRGSE
jgi:RNA polymerase sigma-70 factor (ECF subfamily)